MTISSLLVFLIDQRLSSSRCYILMFHLINGVEILSFRPPDGNSENSFSPPSILYPSLSFSTFLCLSLSQGSIILSILSERNRLFCSLFSPFRSLCSVIFLISSGRIKDGNRQEVRKEKYFQEEKVVLFTLSRNN